MGKLFENLSSRIKEIVFDIKKMFAVDKMFNKRLRLAMASKKIVILRRLYLNILKI